MQEKNMENYWFWCEAELFDEDTKAELRSISGDREEIADRFYKELEFGTGGLRGIMGAGTNRMNRYTVRKATQGLADYICEQGGQEKGVAIACDSRNFSEEFAKETALCLNANGIKTYIFDSLRPTPELSFALRELGCVAGVVITASHNPPEYNGYKVYWEDGAQITAPRDKEIIARVNQVIDYSAIRTMEKSVAVERGLYQVIGDEIDEHYMESLKKLILHSESIQNMASTLKIVYTPIHGTGNVPVRRILKELGFEQVYVVPEQELPDGNFPTVSYPNPEDPKAFSMALELARKVDADIVLATDPDADRLGIYAKDSRTGEYMAFTGNMSGLLLCEYQLSAKREMGILPSNGAIVSTIVSSDLAKTMAGEYGVKHIETLTGFKYIGEQIKFFEEQGTCEFLFGFEESYGCLIGTHARDKDAVVAVMALCEAAAYYKERGRTLCDQMEQIYQKYGYFKEDLFTRTLKGLEGKAQMEAMMEGYRTAPPKKAGAYRILSVHDYQAGIRKNMETGETERLNLPGSDVLYFELEDDGWFCVRPSGTEPKIKYYMGVKGSDAADACEKAEQLQAAILEKQ